jgi:hypothetical protein
MVNMYRSVLMMFEGSKARWIVGRLIDVITRLTVEAIRAI